MTPEDVRLVVSEIMPELKLSQFQFYMIAGLIGLLGSVVGSLAGAYWGANLKKRGEIRASNAHFESISEQLKKTTKDTESIKGTLSERNWVNQQIWLSREKYYTELITGLTNWHASAIDLLDYYPLEESEVDISIKNSDRYKSIAQNGVIARKSVEASLGPALVFLSCATNKTLEKLLGEVWHIGNDSDSTHDALKRIELHVRKARDIILKEAVTELRKALNED